MNLRFTGSFEPHFPARAPFIHCPAEGAVALKLQLYQRLSIPLPLESLRTCRIAPKNTLKTPLRMPLNFLKAIRVFLRPKINVTY